MRAISGRSAEAAITMAALPTSRQSQTSAVVETSRPSQLISHVTHVSNYLKACNSRAAQRHLDIIKHDTPFILALLKKRECQLEAKRDELRLMEDGLHKTIGVEEETRIRMKRKLNALLDKRTRDRAALDLARHEWETTHVRKIVNQATRNVAIGGTVGAGVATVVFGIIFPPSLIVTIPATAVMGTAAIATGVAAELCKEKISDIERVLVVIERQIRTTATCIYNTEKTISELNHKLDALYKERGEIRHTTVFLQKSVSYFADLQVVVEGGCFRTNQLRKIVEKANREEQYAILNSRGGTTVVNSFAKAWKLVEDKYLTGDQAGYFRIKLITCQKLHA